MLNLFLQPQALDNGAVWVPSVASVTGGGLAPDGRLTASHAVISGSGFFSQNVIMPAAGVYTMSFYARNNGGTTASVCIYDSVHAVFILNNVSYFSSLTSAWTRIVFTFTLTAGVGNVQYFPCRGETNADLFLWGAQLEAGAVATTLQGYPSVDNWTTDQVEPYSRLTARSMPKQSPAPSVRNNPMRSGAVIVHPADLVLPPSFAPEVIRLDKWIPMLSEIHH